MKIHQITHLFHPDELAGAALYTDLARYLRDAGHDVRVTTTFSYYPALKYSDSDREVAWRDEVFEGIKVRRVGMTLPSYHKGWRRLIPEISFLAGLLSHGRFKSWEPDVVLTACPMLAQVTWQHWAYSGRVPKLVILQDSMAHAATELAIIRSKWLGRLLHIFERWSLSAADLISTISPEMKLRVDSITRGGVPSIVTPNWIHRSLSDCVSTSRIQKPVRAPNRLFYSGNFGVKQGLPQFLDVFKDIRASWKIDLNGAGSEASALKAHTRGWGDWLSFGPLASEHAYVDRLLTTTACVVTQMSGSGANFLPSKLLPALASGTPVLAICDPDSPLGREVVEGGFGSVVRPGDRASLSLVLTAWLDCPEILRGCAERALQRAELYSRMKICRKYEDVLGMLARCAQTGIPGPPI